MKMILAFAAALVASAGAPAAAVAAPAPAAVAAPQDRVVVRERTTVRRTYGPRYRWRNVCRTQWRHGVRHRVCRRTRYRY